MAAELDDLTVFVAGARAGGFCGAGRARGARAAGPSATVRRLAAARASGAGASSLSEAVRRLEARLGVRLLNRTTRSVAPTEAGTRLLHRLGPALREIDSALEVVRSVGNRPAGTLRLNVPVVAAR